MKNSQHLKAYVQLHPENKMAWYLLGKEYYKNGQHGKANYCFNQAGEVYEAFEHSKVPADMLREYEEGLLQNARQRHASRLKLRRTMVAVVLLLLAFLPAAVAPGSDVAVPDVLAEDNSGTQVPSQLPVAALPEINADNGSNMTDPVPEAKLAFTAQAADAVSSGQSVARIVKNGAANSTTAILGMKRSGQWLLWKKGLPLAATAAKNAQGQTVYQSYDPASCSCQPPEAGELKKQGEAWQESEEQLAVLWSAMRSFKNSKGKLPESLAKLVGPFPKNWLGGTTPLMKEKFAAIRAAAAGPAARKPLHQGGEPTAPEASGIPAGSGGGGRNDTASDWQMPFFDRPLTIIVDKQKHRLAITSGSIILRNYEVGLGGDKTPEGSFFISDKVVNPNGRSNGEFGSRGMQLSDSNYAIHGTDEPDSIGKDDSLGCIRMNRKDVEELFAMVPMGTKVRISKGVLPEELLLPEERFPSGTPQNQTNPRKVYHWLN